MTYGMPKMPPDIPDSFENICPPCRPSECCTRLDRYSRLSVNVGIFRDMCISETRIRHMSCRRAHWMPRARTRAERARDFCIRGRVGRQSKMSAIHANFPAQSRFPRLDGGINQQSQEDEEVVEITDFGRGSVSGTSSWGSRRRRRWWWTGRKKGVGWCWWSFYVADLILTWCRTLMYGCITGDGISGRW